MTINSEDLQEQWVVYTLVQGEQKLFLDQS